MSAIVYLVRHGEVEHHRDDIGITERGHEQARRAGDLISAGIAADDAIHIHHAPVRRVAETAADIRRQLSEKFNVPPLQPDDALCNVRFMARLNGREQVEEPSLLYAHLSDPAYMKSLPPARAKFYRGFYDSADPMGYWMENAHLSDGGAELPETVLNRLLARIKEIHAANVNNPTRSHWIMATHSGALRVFLRHAFGKDAGEPEFCGIITLEMRQGHQVELAYRDASLNLPL